LGSLQRKGSGSYAYRSSKAAVNKVMQVLAQDLRSYGIVACPVHPGWVQTDMGGSQAELSVKESAISLIQLIDGLTLSHSGRFFKWNGEEHPW
jgi:NAD(P)-dependent dehydrogenase (short-subunit alcohol dehydrogenase family)